LDYDTIQQTCEKRNIQDEEAVLPLMYMYDKLRIRITENNEIKQCKGVLQGGVASPFLYDMYLPIHTHQRTRNTPTIANNSKNISICRCRCRCR
jgi:hypothetical protein